MDDKPIIYSFRKGFGWVPSYEMSIDEMVEFLHQEMTRTMFGWMDGPRIPYNDDAIELLNR